MALTMSAAAIHAASSLAPDETLTALVDSLGQDLASTEMHLSLFYGVLDPNNRQLVYSNAGHQHAFRVPRSGAPERLETTSAPLGLTPVQAISRQVVEWNGSTDLLCLWTDGLVDARNADGVPFGEERLLDAICRHRLASPQEIVDAVFAESDAFASRPADDRTILVLRI
jgi:sigma-B regulation protein RsbU (phosphoserine phosphatase)